MENNKKRGRKKLPIDQKKVKIANVWGNQKEKEIFFHVSTNYPELYDKEIQDFIQRVKSVLNS